MSESRSPLARLVLFMVCLALAGSFIAGMHYFVVDLPQQQTIQAPTNEYNCCQMGDCEARSLQCQARCRGDISCQLNCVLTNYMGGQAC
jgi:hypothetical protein